MLYRIMWTIACRNNNYVPFTWWGHIWNWYCAYILTPTIDRDRRVGSHLYTNSIAVSCHPPLIDPKGTLTWILRGICTDTSLASQTPLIDATNSTNSSERLLGLHCSYKMTMLVWEMINEILVNACTLLWLQALKKVNSTTQSKWPSPIAQGWLRISQKKIGEKEGKWRGKRKRRNIMGKKEVLGGFPIPCLAMTKWVEAPNRCAS